MRTRSNRLLLMPALVLIVVLAASSLSFAGGPPSFSFEAPTDSTNRGASNAVLIVHAYSCHQPTDAGVSAHAEGLVAGKRRTIPLKLESTKETGVYTVARQWPSDGSWVLVFSVDRGGQTTTMVKLDEKGNPAFNTVSKSSESRLAADSLRTISGQANEKDINGLLVAQLAR